MAKRLGSNPLEAGKQEPFDLINYLENLGQEIKKKSDDSKQEPVDIIKDFEKQELETKEANHTEKINMGSKQDMRSARLEHRRRLEKLKWDQKAASWKRKISRNC